ncbi:uncharacterized protein V1518DRAFT_418367 [Limtongia smithiae]|uniref:uncharacterized protein n=1 Tax=Limtongia smithiae TaxID=1125753 RepID=UPI0034CF12B6
MPAMAASDTQCAALPATATALEPTHTPSALDTLPEELLETIVEYLAPPFSPSAPSPRKRHMFSLDKSRVTHRSAKPILEGRSIISYVATTSTAIETAPSPSGQQQQQQQRAPTDYADLCALSRVNRRFNAIVTPVLYQNITLCVTSLSTVHDNMLAAIRGPSGAFVRQVSIRDPDPVLHPRIITTNYRNKLIFDFSNFLVNFFAALQSHNLFVHFHWNVFDTLIMPPLFMDMLPSGTQEFTLDQGRVIPMGQYPNLRKFVYRAHMLSYTSKCVYERRVSRLLSLNWANLTYLQLQNVNLSVCFEFRLRDLELSSPNLVTTSSSEQETEILPAVESQALEGQISSTSELGSSSALSFASSKLGSDSGTVPTVVPRRASSPESSRSRQPKSNPSCGPDCTCVTWSNSSSVVHSQNSADQPLIFPNLQEAYFTDFFTSSSVATFTCDWLVQLLTDHMHNKKLTVRYASRGISKDAVFAREWGLLVSDADVASGSTLTDEEAFRQKGWVSGTKSGIWRNWNWEYSTVTGWSFTTLESQH